MRTVVLVHAVPDLASLSISKSQDKIFEKGKRQAFGPDLQAVEAALQNKTSGDEVVVLAWGEEANKEGLRKALAMGADRAAWTAGDPADAAKKLGAERIAGSVHSPLGSNVLPSRVAAELGLADDRVLLVPLDAPPARIANAIAVMKAAKREIETIEAAPRTQFTQRWATLLAAEES